MYKLLNVRLDRARSLVTICTRAEHISACSVSFKMLIFIVFVDSIGITVSHLTVSSSCAGFDQRASACMSWWWDPCKPATLDYP